MVAFLKTEQPRLIKLLRLRLAALGVWSMFFYMVILLGFVRVMGFKDPGSVTLAMPISL